MNNPAEEGFYHPAEWAPHESTWLSWPHSPGTWTNEELLNVLPRYSEFVKTIAGGEKVHINVVDTAMQDLASSYLKKANTDMGQISFHLHPTNDAWCRDHGPDFIINKKNKVMLNFGFNSWGGKYPYELDNTIPELAQEVLNLPMIDTGMILEGGSFDVNGVGDLLTTKSCLLNPNRNPELTEQDIEDNLKKYLGVHKIHWLEDGIKGDDTDGHVDDITRFVNQDTIITVLPEKNDPNYSVLKKNYDILNSIALYNGKKPTILTLPAPAPIMHHGEYLPGSYANFYICNAAVIVPIFNDPADKIALDILTHAFPNKKVIGINSRDIIIGLGSFHCLSKQEPKIQ